MMRSAVSKVMWVGRATVFMVGFAVTLALVLGVATTALGATGASFILGKPNIAETPTSLVSTLADAAKSAFIVQNKSGGPALELRVGNTTTPANDVAPIKVNSNKVVTNLNADQLDGKSEEDFYAAGSKVADSSHADEADYAATAEEAGHASHADSAGNADTLDNIDSSGFLPRDTYKVEINLGAGSPGGGFVVPRTPVKCDRYDKVLSGGLQLIDVAEDKTGGVDAITDDPYEQLYDGQEGIEGAFQDNGGADNAALWALCADYPPLRP